MSRARASQIPQPGPTRGSETPDDGEQRSRATGVVCRTPHVAHLEGSGADLERRTVDACRWRATGKGPRVYWLGKPAPDIAWTTSSSGSNGYGVSLRKLRSGRWHARLKSGRIYVTGKTFDTRRDAQAWLTRERAL